jgi:hypothetical protein
LVLNNSLTGRRSLQRQQLPVPGPLPVRALIDTGADMSVIDNGLATQLKLTLIGFQLLASGAVSTLFPGSGFVPEYSARVEFPNGSGFDITALEVSLPSGLQMLIGRDLLAKGLLIYDGLNNSFTMAF